jgi:hypothetical protein
VEVVPGGGGLADGPGAQVQDVIAVPPDPRVELHYPALRPVTHTSTGQDHRYHHYKELYRQCSYGPSQMVFAVERLYYT